MIRWFLRGVSRRRLTTGYPRRREAAPTRFRARALLDPGGLAGDGAARCARVCLPGALTLDEQRKLHLDGGRCIACGLCIEECDDGSLTIDSGFELASTSRAALSAEHGASDRAGSNGHLGAAFRRSLHIRHVDTGSDGAIEQEIAALLNPYYDMHRLGLFFTASPRHADVLLVTGPVTRPMEQPLRRTYEAMPEPRVVVAAGTDACSGSIWTGPDVLGGVDQVIPVDVYIPGDPPTPIALLHGLLLAAGRARDAQPPRPGHGTTTAETRGGGGAR
jgi:Ni,Fe-hydrogenase III small subunit/formate hydrogenlyase subunit 6/NADH:ubiquinone oxidoreductase subunit I